MNIQYITLGLTVYSQLQLQASINHLQCISHPQHINCIPLLEALDMV